MLRETTSLVEQYEVLRANIELMKKETKSTVRSLVNIGSEVFVQARAEDRNHIFINVGLGFHVEFTLDEAITYIDKRLSKLKSYSFFWIITIAIKKKKTQMLNERNKTTTLYDWACFVKCRQSMLWSS